MSELTSNPRTTDATTLQEAVASGQVRVLDVRTPAEFETMHIPGAYNVPLARIVAAVKAASSEVGGRVIEQAETELVVRSTGYVRNLAELSDVVVFAENGTPVKLGDIARIVEGPELHRGVAVGEVSFGRLVESP